MIPPELLDFSKQRIAIEFDERERAISQEIQTILAQHAAKGLVKSGNVIVAVQDACAKEVHKRVELAWEIIFRGLSTIGVNYDVEIENELCKFLETLLTEHVDRLKNHVLEIAKRVGMADIANRIPDDVESARRAALGRACSEIKLYVLKLQTETVSMPYSPQFNIINSSIGSIQTGNYAVANVDQQIGAEVTTTLLAALDLVSQLLAQVDDGQLTNKGEIIEIIQDSKVELAKETPNGTKLSSYIQTVGGVISTIGALKPAYDALKSAAAFIGIPLP